MSNLILVTDEVMRERLEICEACPEKVIKPVVGLVCSKCGCVMKLKASLKHFKCPINKWLAEK